MYRICQVCGNPVFSAGGHGTEADGRLNWDYCSSCYKEGHFYNKDSPVDYGGGVPFGGLLSGLRGQFGNSTLT